MSKFCQHPDCPKTTQGLEQCPLCGYPVRRQPKPTDAKQLAGTMAATGCLSQIVAYFLIMVVAMIGRFLPVLLVQIFMFSSLILIPTVFSVGMLFTRKRDIQIMAKTLDQGVFQKEVNHAIEIGYRWGVVSGAALLVGIIGVLLTKDSNFAGLPFALLTAAAVTIGIPVTASMFIYSKQLRKYRMPLVDKK